jgi:hypothetical protein
MHFLAQFPCGTDIALLPPMTHFTHFSTSFVRMLCAAVLALPLVIGGCGDDSQTHVGAGGGGGSGGSGGNGGGGGGGDGSCSADKPCANGSCVYNAGSCAAGATGVCQDFFQCDGPSTGPLCGCDGKTIEGDYPDCIVAMANSPYDHAGACQTGTFACGPALNCKRNSEVCAERLPGPGGPIDYECMSYEKVNQWCLGGIPACDCIDVASFGEGANCKEDADHQETVTVALP